MKHLQPISQNLQKFPVELNRLGTDRTEEDREHLAEALLARIVEDHASGCEG